MITNIGLFSFIFETWGSPVRYSDCVMHFSNDEILYRLLKRNMNKDSDNSVSISQMNEHIASCLSNVLAPNDSVSPK